MGKNLDKVVYKRDVKLVTLVVRRKKYADYFSFSIYDPKFGYTYHSNHYVHVEDCITDGTKMLHERLKNLHSSRS